MNQIFQIPDHRILYHEFKRIGVHYTHLPIYSTPILNEYSKIYQASNKFSFMRIIMLSFHWICLRGVEMYYNWLALRGEEASIWIKVDQILGASIYSVISTALQTVFLKLDL